MPTIVPLAPADIPEVLALWAQTEGMSLRDADSPEALGRFLERNPGCSFIARRQGRLAGVALAGHDGRRGYLYHVAVAATERRQGVGRGLVEHCLTALYDQGILKSHLFVFDHNEEGKKFWRRLGFQERPLRIMSITRTGSENA